MRAARGLLLLSVVAFAQSDTRELAAALSAARPILLDIRSGDRGKAVMVDLKARTAAWTEARIARGLSAAEMNRELRAAGVIRKETPGEFERDIELSYRAFQGFISEVSVTPIDRAPDLLDVRTAIGVGCGYIETASVFDAKTRRLIVRFDPEDSAGPPIKYSKIAAGTVRRPRLIAAASSSYYCTSTISGAHLEAFDETGKRLLRTFRSIRNYDPVEVVVAEEVAVFRYAWNISDDAFLWIHGISKFELRGGELVRVPPLATSRLGLIEEWIGGTTAEVESWTSPAALKRHGEFGGSVFYSIKQTQKCPGVPERWQARLDMEKPKRAVRYFVVEGSNAYVARMAEVRDTPLPGCAALGVSDIGKPF